MPKSASRLAPAVAKPRKRGSGKTTGAEAKRPRVGRPVAAEAAFDVRERILDVAEEHFSKHGFEGVSTRIIAKHASTTSGMIHYYFSTKRALFDAVFARRADIVNKERIDSLNAYEAAAGDKVTLEGAIAAFLRPVMEKLETGGEGWRNYMALVGWVASTHDWGGAVMTRSFDPVIERLIQVIRKALPHAHEEDLYWGYHFLSGALTLTISETDRIDRLSKGKCRSTDIAAIEPRMVAFAAAGFRQVCGKRK
jgi:AcrR family transcriptional regulator